MCPVVRYAVQTACGNAFQCTNPFLIAQTVIRGMVARLKAVVISLVWMESGKAVAQFRLCGNTNACTHSCPYGTTESSIEGFNHIKPSSVAQALVACCHNELSRF